MAGPTMASGLVRLVLFGPERRVGIWAGESILDAAVASAGRLPASLIEFILAGDAAIDGARELAERAAAGDFDGRDGPVAVRFSEALLHPPVVDRPRIACAAGNYVKHTLGSAARKGAGASRALQGLLSGDEAATGRLPAPEELEARMRERGVPRGFWKDSALAAGPGDDIRIPARAQLFDYEGEVAIVIGRAARDVPAARVHELVWGVTLLNDWSIRGTSHKDSLTFNLSKNFDGGVSIGPSVVAGGLDPAALHVQTHVNGDLRQDYDSGDMVFSHAEYVEYLSRDFTFLPGDLVSGGSGPGSATDAAKGDPPDTSLFLRPGDVVEVSTSPIGTLRNRVVGA